MSGAVATLDRLYIPTAIRELQSDSIAVGLCQDCDDASTASIEFLGANEAMESYNVSNCEGWTTLIFTNLVVTTWSCINCTTLS